MWCYIVGFYICFSGSGGGAGSSVLILVDGVISGGFVIGAFFCIGVWTFARSWPIIGFPGNALFNFAWSFSLFFPKNCKYAGFSPFSTG